MNRYLSLIIQKANWKKAVIFTLLFVVFYILINFSDIGVAGLLKITHGANILDLERFGYSHEKAFQILTALGAEGRAFYLTKILPLDFPLPFVYMLCFAGWMAFLLKRVAVKEWFKYLLFIPFLSGLFDWLENICIIIMLKQYPMVSAVLYSAASFMTVSKSIFTITSVMIILILLVIDLRTRNKKSITER